MNLKKALEKAKQTRGEVSRLEVAETPPELVKNEGNKSDKRWVPPVYSKSRHIELNTETVLENRCICIDPNSIEIESYKILRTKIQHLTKQKGLNTVMITSARPGEGKTLTSINLALTFAKAYNQTVMLVDCDLRNQDIHKVLGFQSNAGLIDYLMDDRPLHETIIWPGIDKLTLISGGRTFQDSAELMGSPRMQTLVKELKSRYDDRYILFDVPPLLVVADALALAPYIDCIVMVVEEGKTSATEVTRAVEMLPKEKFIGFVMNRQTSIVKEYYGYYK